MLKFQDKKQIKNKRKIIRKTILLVLFFIATSLGALNFLGSPLNFISRPVLEIGSWFSQGFDNISFYFDTKKNLLQENKFLLEENLFLKAKMENYEILEKENRDLKYILNRPQKERNFVLANILTKSNRSLYGSVILDIGKNDNISIGNTVYAYGEIPIGKISEVYEKTSLLTFFSSPGLKTEGFLGDVNASVELIGRGGGNFETTIPVDLNLEKGTIVYTPGYDSRVLARIVEIISKQGDPLKKVILNASVNTEDLKWVQVKLNQ